jgi:putative transposase
MRLALAWIHEGFPAKRVLRILEIARSTYYFQLAKPVKSRNRTGGRPIPGFSKTNQGKKVKDTKIKEYLMELIEGKSCVYGYRKLTKDLRKHYKLIINKKKVYRLCKELDILMPQREKKTKYPRRLAKNRIVTGPNQLWQLDIKYGYVTSSRRFFYVASAIDVFDRTIVGHYRGMTCEAKQITKMLQKAFIKRGIHKDPENEQTLIIRTDNGPQFISKHFEEFLQVQHVEHERIPPKTPNLNAYIESFHSVLERECFRPNEFVTFQQAFDTLDEYIKFYNEERYHGSLKDDTPQEYYQKWQQGIMAPKKLAM